jgi:uncharacterized protein YkuJ
MKQISKGKELVRLSRFRITEKKRTFQLNKHFAWVLAILLISCQEEVELPLASLSQNVPVIEANWTDQRAYNEVRISFPQSYYERGSRKIISDAEVLIREVGSSKVIRFGYRSGSFSYKAFNSNEIAKIGKTYRLEVKWQGKVFVGEGTMLEPPILDSLTYEYVKKKPFRNEGYYIKVFGKIPFQNDNNYRIRVIENDTLKNGRNDYLLFDDTFGLNFFEEGLQLNYAFDAGDMVSLELYRLNGEMYDYFTQLVNLLFSDGGLFSPPPQNPRSNIRVVQGKSDVLGFFLVSPVLRRTVKIEEKK